MTSPTKNSYMGQNLRRMPRSELEDSVQRDQNRHGIRLTVEMKNVDRARDVVLKSLESEKKNFMRGGMNSNKKLIKSTSRSPMDSRQASAVALQHNRYVSDMRTRRAYEQVIMSRRPSVEVISSFKPIRSKTDLSDIRSESKKKLDTDREDDLNNNDEYRPSSVDDYITSKDVDRSKPKRTASNSPNDNYPGPRASITPTIKIDDYDRVSTSPHREDDTKSGLSDLANGRDGHCSPPGGTVNVAPEMTKRQTSFVLDRSSHVPSTMPLPFSDDYYFGRRKTFWDYMSTPKNPNLNRQKRAELEMEFAMRSQESLNSARSAKGQRSTMTTTTMKSAGTAKPVSTPRAKSSTTKRSVSGSATPSTKLSNSNKGKQLGNK